MARMGLRANFNLMTKVNIYYLECILKSEIHIPPSLGTYPIQPRDLSFKLMKKNYETKICKKKK